MRASNTLLGVGGWMGRWVMKLLGAIWSVFEALQRSFDRFYRAKGCKQEVKDELQNHRIEKNIQ